MDSLLFGSWEIKYTTLCEDVIPIQNSRVLTSFFKDHIFQKKYIYPHYNNKGEKDRDTVFYESGKWDLDTVGKILTTSGIHYIMKRTVISEVLNSYKIKVIADSILELSSSATNYVSIQHYVRTSFFQEVPEENMKGFYKHNVFLVNTLDPTRILDFKNKNDLSIELDTVYRGDFYKYYLTGTIDSMDEGYLYYNVYQEKVSLPGRASESHLKYNNNVYETLYNKTWINRPLSIGNINYLKYTNQKMADLDGIGRGIIVVSSITTFLVSPLASINYKTGAFNAKQYYTMAGIGLAGICVGIPFIIFNKEKTYNITPKNKRKDKNYWYFEGN